MILDDSANGCPLEVREKTFSQPKGALSTTYPKDASLPYKSSIIFKAMSKRLLKTWTASSMAWTT